MQTERKDMKHVKKSVKEYLSNLSSDNISDYSLWRATKRLKQPVIGFPPPLKTESGGWARIDQEKADL